MIKFFPSKPAAIKFYLTTPGPLVFRQTGESEWMVANINSLIDRSKDSFSKGLAA